MIYQATIKHSSISRARVIDCGDNLTKAKAIASKEFGDGFRDHVIVIFEADDDGLPVSSRVIGSRRWRDTQYAPGKAS